MLNANYFFLAFDFCKITNQPSFRAMHILFNLSWISDNRVLKGGILFDKHLLLLLITIHVHKLLNGSSNGLGEYIKEAFYSI